MKIVHSPYTPKPAARLQAADVRAIELGDVTPLATGGGHQTFSGSRVDNHQAVFVKHNLLNQVTTEGKLPGPVEKVVNKLEPWMARTMQRIFPHLDRYQDMTETMLSHALKRYFTSQNRPYSGVTYNEAFYRQDGQPRLGIAAPMVPHLGTLTDVPADKVTNDKEAVEGTLLRGMLLGDFDVMFNNGNTAVARQDGTMSDGTPVREGQALLMDFGEAGHKGIGFLGVPYANRSLLVQCPQYIKPAVENILKLDRHAIRDMVADGGSHVTGWTDSMTDHFTDMMTKNLDNMRKKWEKNPDWFYPDKSHNPLAKGRHADGMQTARGFMNYLGLRVSGQLNAIPSNQDVADKMATLMPQWQVSRG